MFDKVPLTFEYDDVITVTWHILSNLIMMLLKIGQQKNPQNLKLERITNQKIQKLSKMHVYIVKYRHLNTWDTHVPMERKGWTIFSVQAPSLEYKSHVLGLNNNH